MAVKWSDTYSVEIESIDRQHQRLFQIINDLGAGVEQGKTTEAIAETIAELIKYTKEHFSTEEKLFAKHAYPEAAEHKVQHDKFVEKVSEFKERFEAGKMTMSVEMRLFLSNWLVTHILKVDKNY